MTAPTPPSKEAIRQARDASGLTQTEAAALIYRTCRNWQQWEAGDRKMDPALWELFWFKARQAGFL